MKKITLLSLAAAALLFTACGEDTKKAAAEATAKVTEAVKIDTANAVDATKKAAAEAAEAAKAKAAEVAAAAKIEADKMAAAAAEKATEAKAAAEAKAAEAVEATKEVVSNVVDSVKDTASETTTAVSEAIDTAKEAVAPVADNAAGEAVYAKCKGCHGKNGKIKALGKSEAIAGQSANDIESKLMEYKAGTRNISGMGSLMKGQVASMDEATIKAVSEYISGL